ncbi:TFIIB-type zinc ribbon-containing protein [Arthrobacter oryzae]|uniref:TFIIB-type zinc ribbon-containing protein n=1 Tax=Arthrobacter oryzae TaxID=409290 RepID=UPI0027D9206F|nr:zf-TFIIB domain-containing protein [Arthrobacter oryzae]
MKCPVDSVDLIMSERSGVEIDYCPQCRGVWLDRGELDKIIDRAAELMGPAATAAPVAPAAAPVSGLIPPPLYNNLDPSRDDRRGDDRRHDERRDRPRYDQPRYDDRRYDDRRRPKKKEGWLGELFDF